MDEVMETFDSGQIFSTVRARRCQVIASVQSSESCHNIRAYYMDLVTVNDME